MDDIKTELEAQGGRTGRTSGNCNKNELEASSDSV
jgi:hypothetical protein